jgi:hypothetical protein
MNDDEEVTLHTLDPLKRSMIKNLLEFRRLYKQYKKQVHDHNRFTADPVAEILQDVIEDVNKRVFEAHVRDALTDGLNFSNYVGSTDNAYRFIRNYGLEQILDKAVELRAALEKERQVEDYRDPSKCYDNRKVILRQRREELRSKGLLKDDEFLPEEVPFMDDLQWKMYSRQQEEKTKKR